MAKEYKLEVNRRERKPRSKRLRELGVAGSGNGNGSTVVEVNGSGGGGNQHSHANLSMLDRLSADDESYVYIDQLREGTDEDGNTVWTTEREKIKACHADRAQNLSEDSSDWEAIDDKDAAKLTEAKAYTDETALSKRKADTAHGLIDFLEGLSVGDYKAGQSGGHIGADGIAEFMSLLINQLLHVTGDATIDGDVKIRGLLRLLSGVQSDDFIDSMTTGRGWQIDKAGKAQVESIEVRSSMRVLELVYNRLSAEESDYLFSESGTVDEVKPLDDGTYDLVMRRRSDNDFTAFACDDILKGVVNNLSAVASVGSAYGSCWLRVNSVDTSSNVVNATLYGDDDVPGGDNMSPTPLMVLHRWGSVSDRTRQSCWYISSIEKRIVMLDGVTSPILSEENYAAFFGLPYNLSTFKGHSMNASQPYLYVRGAFLQDIHFIDYQGNVVKQERFRGTWSSAVAQGASPYIVTETTFDTVYHNNAKWQCAGSVGIAVTAEPSAGSGLWIKLEEGVKGAQGAKGEKGDKGEKGEQGERGANGADGIDGLAPRILYMNSDSEPAAPTAENPAGWHAVPEKGGSATVVDNMSDFSVETLGTYGFVKVVEGNDFFFKSGNYNISSSTAKAKIKFMVNEDCTITIVWSVSSESNYDKGSLYAVDSTSTKVVDAVSGVKNGTYSAEVQKGEHFIIAEYTKDGSVNSNSDIFVVQPTIEKITKAGVSNQVWVIVEKLIDGVFSGWSAPIRYNGADGTDGADGKNGANGKNSIVLKGASAYPTSTLNQWITAGATYTWTVLAVAGAEVGMGVTVVVDDTTTGGYREYYGIITSVNTSSKQVTFVCKGYSDNGAKGESPVIYEADFDTANFIVDKNGEIKNTLTAKFYKVVGNTRSAFAVKDITAYAVKSNGDIGEMCGWGKISQLTETPNIESYCTNYDDGETFKDYNSIRFTVTFVDGVVKQYVIPLVQEGQQGPQGPQGPQGASGVSVVVQYSTNATSWHSTFATGDKWMRTRMSNSSTWGAAMKIVGENGTNGTNGTNGSYMDYRFAISNVSETGSSTNEPSIYGGTWSDAPVPTTADYPYLWMRTQMMEWNASGNAYVGGTKHYTRLTGEKGADGARGAILRGPTEWNAGISYAGGTVSESYQDIVVRTVDGVSEFFLCRYPNIGKDPHNTAYQSNTGPWNDTTGKYWQKSQMGDFVATKVLFAEKSKIKNLQVDDVLVYGADGTVKAEINSDRIYLDIPVQENYRTPQDESSDVYVPRALLIQGDDIHSYSMPKVKDLYNAVILPQYRDVTFGDITIKGCTQSGLHLVINAGYSDECPTWRFLEESTLANLSDMDRRTLWKNALFVCSDIQHFLGDYATSSIPVHNINGENVQTNTDYIHGQMRFNGAIARFCAMLPGQTLHLVSQIADYTDYNGTTHSMCVWNVINASDYEPIEAEVKRGSQSNTFPTTYGGIRPDGVDMEWSDLFFAPHQLCYNGRYYLGLANAAYGTDGLFYSPGIYVFEK